MTSFERRVTPPIALGQQSTLSSSNHQVQNGGKTTTHDVSEFLKQPPGVKMIQDGILQQRQGDLVEDIYYDSQQGVYMKVRSPFKNLSYFQQRLFNTTPNEIIPYFEIHKDIHVNQTQEPDKNDNIRIDEIQHFPVQDEKIESFEQIDDTYKKGNENDKRIIGFSKFQNRSSNNVSNFQFSNNILSNNASMLIHESCRNMLQTPIKSNVKRLATNGGISKFENNKVAKLCMEIGITNGENLPNKNKENQPNKIIPKSQYPWRQLFSKQQMRKFFRIVLILVMIFVMGCVCGIIGYEISNSYDEDIILIIILYPLNGILIQIWSVEQFRQQLAIQCMKYAENNNNMVTLNKQALSLEQIQYFYSKIYFKRVLQNVTVKQISMSIFFSLIASMINEIGILPSINKITERDKRPQESLLANVILRSWWLYIVLALNAFFQTRQKSLVKYLLKNDQNTAEQDRNQLTSEYYDQFERDLAQIEVKIAQKMQTQTKVNNNRKSARMSVRMSAIFKSPHERSSNGIISPISKENFSPSKGSQFQNKLLNISNETEKKGSEQFYEVAKQVTDKIINEKAILRDWVQYWIKVSFKEIMTIMKKQVFITALLASCVLLSLVLLSDYLYDSSQMIQYYVCQNIYYCFASSVMLLPQINYPFHHSSYQSKNDKEKYINIDDFRRDYSFLILLYSAFAVGDMSARLEHSNFSILAIESQPLFKYVWLLLIASIVIFRIHKKSNKGKFLKSVITFIKSLLIFLICQIICNGGFIASLAVKTNIKRIIHSQVDYSLIYLSVGVEALSLISVVLGIILVMKYIFIKDERFKEYSICEYIEGLIKKYLILFISFNIFAWQLLYLFINN